MAKTLTELLEEKRKREEEEQRRFEAAISGKTAGENNNQSSIEALGGQSSGNASVNLSGQTNRGGLLGGVGYVGQSILSGAVRGVEGIVDYTVGGLASLFGGTRGRSFAEQMMLDDWFNYNAAAERFNPGNGWKLAGDVAGGVGQSVFAIGVGAAASLLSGGALAPAAVTGIGAAVGGLSAAGTGVSEAVKDESADKQGLDYTDWLYGTGSGVLEAGIEVATGGVGKIGGKLLGKTAGEMGSEIAEAITKKAVKNTVTSSVGKDLLKEMAGEGLEEGLSTFLEPYIKQATYDKDAKNATLGDITYSALVGALAGGATMGGVELTTSTINTVSNAKRGADIAADSKKTADLLKNAEVISGYERERETGSEIFEAVMAQYEKVKTSLASTDGKAQTNEQKRMLGELDRYVASAAIQPAIVNAAKGVALNAESYAESLNSFYKKTNNGRTVTAEELTAGLDLSGDSKAFVRSVNKAMRTNSTLREVVVNNTLGRMELDAVAYADSIYGDTRISSIATRENINRFVEIADAETLQGVNTALGVDMRNATPEVVAAAIKQFRDSGKAAEYEGGYRDIIEAKKLEEGSGDVEADTRTGYADIETLERMLESAEGRTQSAEFSGADGGLREGATRFQGGETDIAVIKRGNSYRIYDYRTGKITRALTRSELRDAIKRMRGGERPAIEVIGKFLENGAQSADGRMQSAELDRFALEKVPEYKKLVETEREAVRETVRRALDNGVSEEDAALFGRIAAKSGMNIVVNTSSVGDADTFRHGVPRSEQRELWGFRARGRLGSAEDAWYDGANTVYVIADADRSRTFSGLLGHEMWHKMFKAKKAKRIMMQAYNRLDKDERAEVEKLYREDSERLGLDEKVIKNIGRDEVAAAYAEKIFNSPDVWEFVLSEEPSLADRVLSFFKGANKKYSFEPGMTRAAKKWLSEYKKLFNEVSAYNKGRNVAENVGASDKVRKIERLGRIVESGESAEFRTQNAELDDGSRKAIAFLDNGNTFVIATRKVITGETKAEQRKQISRFFNVLLEKKQSLDIHTLEGDILTITKSDTAKKARDDYKTVNGNPVPMSDDEFRVKLNAEAHIDELAEISKTKKPKSADTKGHSFAKDGFTYRTAYFEDFDGKYYKITLSIGHKGEVATVYNVGEIKENVPSSAKIIAVTSSKALDETFSNSSISDSAKKSNSFDENSSKKVDDGSRAALKKSDKEYRDEVKAKTDERVRKEKEKAKAYAKEKIAEATAKTEAKYERATETAKARLEAEYRTDTTFGEASVKKSFDSVEAISKLKKSKREEIARDLWLELQMSDDAAVRNSFVLKYSVKLYDEIRRADYDAYDNMTYGERDALKGELEAMMKKIVKSGKASLRTKMEGDIGDRARLEAEVRSNKLAEIHQSLKKIDDVKRERFLAASSYKSDEFKKTIEALTRIDWRGKFSDNVARGEVKKLLSWYTPKNPMFEGFKDGDETISTEFNEGIRIRLEMLSEREGRFTNSELDELTAVIKYFSELVTNYDRVWLNNRWVSGEETVRGFLDIYNKQKEVTLPIVTRALRNKIMGQQTFGDPLSVMKLADLYEDGIFTTYYSEWQNAEIAAAAEEARILEEYNEFFKKKENKNYLKQAMKDTVDLHGVEVRRIDYIEYVMTLKRKQAFEGVEYGGIVVTDKNGDNVKIYPLPMIGDGRGYSAKLEAAVDAEYKRAVKALSKADLEYMKILERGYELTRQAKAIGDVQRLGFVSVVEGYYYPIRRAYTEHLSEFDGAAAATDKFANAGFNKRTKQDSNSALRIGSADDTFHRHVHGISGYVHLSPVMDSFNKVYKLKVLKTKPGLGADVSALMKLRGATTSLQEAIDQNKSTWKNKNGKSVGFEYLQEIMLDTMGKTPSGKGDDFASWLRSGYVTFALGANPKVLLTQISSLFASTSVLSKRSHFLGAFNKTKNVDDYSIVAKLRNGTDTVAKAQGVVENINEKAQFFMKGIEFVDRQVIKRAFAACQAEVARTEGFKIGTEENLKAAGKLLDKVILETQQNTFASSKTAAARRGGALAKTLQMFKSDAVKGSARVIDAMGEAAYIKKLLDNKELSDTERKALEKRLKNANKNLRRSLLAVAMSSVYMVLIAELFRSFYGKNDEEEEKKDKWLRRGAEFIGNMLGGLPLYGELWNSFTSQFGDIEAMEFSAINDILDTANKVIDYVSDGIQGKNDGKDTAKLLENFIYGVGQIFGVPVRNVKNFAYGVLRLVDKNAAYAFDSIFKDMTYASDLENAIELEDDDLALTILELAMREKLGSGLSDGAIGELARLAALGESVLPSAVGDTVTVDGEERELSGSELSAVRAKYAEAVERINVFIESAFYKSLDDRQKAAAVRKIYTLYKDLGYDSTLGTERDKKALILSKVVPGEALVTWDACTVLEADKDEDGKTISGSLKAKVIDAIWQLDIPDVQKLLLIASKYKLSDGDIPGVSGYSAQMALYEYIKSLEGLTDEERLDLFEASGFEIKGGVAQEPTYKASSSSKKIIKLGRITGGTMQGSMHGADYTKKIVKIGKILNK